MSGGSPLSVADLVPVMSSLFALVAWLAVLTVLGIVLVVALVRARPEDIPVLVRDAAGVFRRLADRLPGGPVPRDVDGPPPDHPVEGGAVGGPELPPADPPAAPQVPQ